MSERKQAGTIAILGATSMIGREIADVLASRGTNLILFARNVAECAGIASGIEDRHNVKAVTRTLDVLGFDAGEFRRDLEAAAPIDGAILCIGYLGDNAKAFSDTQEAARIMDINFTGCA